MLLRQKCRGMSLIEAVISMWIVGIVAFSVLVCTTSIDSKSNQKRIMALILAKREIEECRKKILLGNLNFKESSGDSLLFKKGDRVYQDSKVFVIEDRTVNLLYDKNSANINNFDIDPESLGISKSFAKAILEDESEIFQKLKCKKGEIICTVYPEESTSSTGLNATLREQRRELYNLLHHSTLLKEGKEDEHLSLEDEKGKDRYSFIVDTNINHESVDNIVFKYSFKVVSAWFERLKGRDILKKEVLYMEMASKSKGIRMD